MNIPETYYTQKIEALPEYNAQTWQLYHKKSGARLFIIKNDDPNRVFTVGFRTPPADSTGLPHILEHSVLCGSRKFPVKDPFIELEKGSLKTFLNAMTYPDKTVYPVASCNEKDFRNLMDVYLDAVFYPAIYKEPKIFRQEGWHYEMEDADSPIIINGVVYNEMKGAFSSPDDVLERYCQTVLYPDTPYTHESGGDPEVIPSLTYEDFIAFHKKYYHPSNSFIYLYGDLDIEEQLNWLDAEYLSHFDAIPVDSAIPLQAPFAEPAQQTIPYPIGREEDPAEKAFLSEEWVIGDITDPRQYVAFQILEAVLLGMPGAPVYQALTDAGIGEEIYGGYQNSSRQPYFNVVAKHASEDALPEFRRILRETLEAQVRDGIDRKALESAINSMEFKQREADYGIYPKGLMIGIECFDSWLYGADPLVHLQYEKVFSWLREQLDTGYFEELVKTWFLDNMHSAVIVLRAVPGLTEEKDAALAQRLADYKASLTPEELQRIVDDTAALKAWQDAPATEEELATLPTLALSDIPRKARELKTTEKKIGDLPVLHQEIFTGGILYTRFLFRIDMLEAEEIPYASLLKSMLSFLSTESWSYRELAQEIGLNTGGLSVRMSAYGDADRADILDPYMEVNIRVLKEKLPKALLLVQEILQTSRFDDEKRLKDLITELMSRVTTGLQNAGHSTAMTRAASYTSRNSWYNEQIGGIDYLMFLRRISEELSQPDGAKKLGEKLQKLAKKIFVRNGMIASLTAPAEDFALFEQAVKPFRESFPKAAKKKAAGRSYGTEDFYRPSRADWPFTPNKKNEAFATAGQVQYVAVTGNFVAAGHPYHGSMNVLRRILGDEYLWVNVRVKGGAYGCMCGFGRTGIGYFVSYRDPNLADTLEVYKRIVPWLEEFDATEREMTSYIIGTIGGIDQPLNPSSEGAAAFSAYMSGITQEMMQQVRDEILACTVEDIRALAPHMKAILESDQRCVVGNAGKIEEAKELFGEVVSL